MLYRWLTKFVAGGNKLAKKLLSLWKNRVKKKRVSKKSMDKKKFPILESQIEKNKELMKILEDFKQEEVIETPVTTNNLKTKIYINGELFGTCDNPVEFTQEMREKRTKEEIKEKLDKYGSDKAKYKYTYLVVDENTDTCIAKWYSNLDAFKLTAIVSFAIFSTDEIGDQAEKKKAIYACRRPIIPLAGPLFHHKIQWCSETTFGIYIYSWFASQAVE